MPEMGYSKSLIVGQLAGVFGVKGWLKVRSFTAPAENILSYSAWRLTDNQRTLEVEVDQYQKRPQGVVVHFKGVDDRDAAAGIARYWIEIDNDQLPTLGDGDYYWHQLIGLTVISEYAGAKVVLGAVSDLMETGANDVLVVSATSDSCDQRERLVPYVFGQYVRRIDLVAGEIYVDWDPEF